MRAGEVSSYLASKGWDRDGEWNGATIWRLGSEARLLVPDLHQYEDAEELIERAISTIAAVEERPEGDVRLDITEPLVDAQYYRTHPSGPSGWIPLPAGLKAVRSIHELMRDAAITVEKGPHLLIGVAHRKDSLVDTFLNRVMLGAAVPGSYVLTARIPTVELRSAQLNGSGEFSGRAIGKALHHALQSAFTAAEAVASGHGSGGVFYERVQDGVSANLCKALGDLGGQHRENPFDIGFTWARGEDGQEPTEPLHFRGGMAGILWRAGQELESLAKSGRARITGLVEDLRQREGEGPRVRVVGQLQTRVDRGGESPTEHRSLWVLVSPTQYEEAYQAQRRRRAIDVEGELTTNNRRLELIVQSFRVLG